LKALLMTAPLVPVFDGHNDVLLRLWRRESPAGGPTAVDAFLNGEARGHIDLPKAITGGLAGGLYAIFVPSRDGQSLEAVNASMATGSYELPLPPLVALGAAQEATFAMAAILLRIEAASKGRVRVCRSVADIRAAVKAGAHAPVLHIEGAEAIDADFYALEVLHRAGLRSLGPVWSRSNIFAHGVPFRFPSSPDTGPGLTDAGKALIKACNDLRILIDLSHLNEKGFWDVAKLSNAPLVATHSNVHALCAASRNLTAKQLSAIRESKGLVGVNFATSFLRPDGRRIADTSLDMVIDHVARLVDALGEDAVGLGSDFDGAQIPDGIRTAAGLPNLIAGLRARGFGADLIEKIAFENWMRVLTATWGH
jgi:membrane dipeptidase